MSAIVQENTDNGSNLKGYLFWWSGQLISLLGSSIVQFVIIWWITITTKSALYLSLASVAGFLPVIILSPIAGVFVDRWNRKKIIVFVDSFQAIATVVLIFLFKFNYASIWSVMVILAIRGSLQAFQGPAIQAIIPLLVPKKHLSRINSIGYLFNSVIFLVGPVIAALLYAFVDIANILWIDGITFLIAVIPLLLITIPSVVKKEKLKENKESFIKEFSEGFRFMKERKGLLSLLLVFTTVNFFMMPLFTLLNLFIYSDHGGNEANLAFVMVFMQVGAILGAILFTFWKGFQKRVVGVFLGIIAIYVAYFVITFAPEGMFWLIGIGLFIAGFGLPIANVSSQTIWQTVVPPEKIGRVFSVRITIAQAAGPIGMVLSGILAEVFNIIPVFLVSASVGAGIVIFAWFFSKIKHVEEELGIDTQLVQGIEKEHKVKAEEKGVQPIPSSD